MLAHVINLHLPDGGQEIDEDHVEVPPRAQKPALSGVPGVGAATAGHLWGAGRCRAPTGVPGRPAGSLHGGRAQHSTGAAGRGHVDGGGAGGHAILRSDRCPFCRGAPETEPHILWDCPPWEWAHGNRTWMPWVL